jgi:hypothetical protein
VKVVTSWITTSLVIKPGFINMNQKPNGTACNRSTRHLLPKNSHRSPYQQAVVDDVLWVPWPNCEIDMDRSITATSVNCCDMLTNELKPAIHNNQRGKSSQGVVSLHENARPPTEHLTINTIQKLNWEVLEDPAHSPDLDPSDCHLFGPNNSALRSSRFADNDEMQKAVHDRLRN